MTGFAESPGDTGVDRSLPLSRVSIGLVEDLGYSVNYNEAEQFTPMPDNRNNISIFSLHNNNSSGTY